MEREANYVAVGVFIIVVVAMAVTFVVWYTDAGNSREYSRYEIYFKGSVSGLDRGSPVRYLGVDVGRVRALSISGENRGAVQAIVDVDESAPITSATRARLGLQGVTGLLYIDLREAANADPNQPLRQGERYPVIESVASDFDVFLSSLPELMARANAIVERMSRVFSDENLESLSVTLKNLRASTDGLPAAVRNAAALIDDMRAAMAEVNGAAASLRGIAEESRPEIRTALQRLTTMAGNLESASARVDRFIGNSEKQLQYFSNQGLFEIEQLVREAQVTAREFRDLARSLKENPSQLFYQPPPQGVRIDP
jgi:phospholipid/cholesterol/gamma-HCH transport system substrate-binding protein